MLYLNILKLMHKIVIALYCNWTAYTVQYFTIDPLVSLSTCQILMITCQIFMMTCLIIILIPRNSVSLHNLYTKTKLFDPLILITTHYDIIKYLYRSMEEIKYATIIQYMVLLLNSKYQPYQKLRTFRSLEILFLTSNLINRSD